MVKETETSTKGGRQNSTAMKIALKQTWELGKLLHSGGFGEVFMAKASDGKSPAVIKLIPKEPGASRELLFVSLTGLPNIIPIIDSGEWKNYYVLVMPLAEKSLRQHLESSTGKLALDETVTILKDIAEALSSLSVEVVHRDLKPENVLFYKGHWCLADFGIARYAEASTAPDTHKFAMTPPYAAPEQWRAERATNATDVYAFGIMAFELLQGQRPFLGPDFREQHLNQPPPAIIGCPPSISSLVNECLFKAPSARTKAANILGRLQASQKTPSPSAGRLQAVNQVIVQQQAEQDAKISAQKSREEIRLELFKVAEQSLNQIIQTIRERALEAAPKTTVALARGLELQLGNGALIIDTIQRAPENCLAAYNYAPPFDVIAYTAIAARKPQDHYGYEGRAHALWFCDAHDENVYRWYELAFMVRPGVRQGFSLDPFALPPNDKDAAGAFSPVMGIRQIAWQPVPFDQGNEEQFIERWLGWFAQAVDGSLSHPSSMPENSGGRYRRPH